MSLRSVCAGASLSVQCIQIRYPSVGTKHRRETENVRGHWEEFPSFLDRPRPISRSAMPRRPAGCPAKVGPQIAPRSSPESRMQAPQVQGNASSDRPHKALPASGRTDGPATQARRRTEPVVHSHSIPVGEWMPGRSSLSLIISIARFYRVIGIPEDAEIEIE